MTLKTELDCLEIRALIPHRYPMLLVDRIIEMKGSQSAIGVKNVTINEPFFQGHFPEFPIMPGVLIVEAMAQTAGAIVCHALDDAEKGTKTVFFMTIENARFRKPVLPGHVLHLHVEALQNRRSVWKYKGMAYVGEELHAEATFTAMIADK